jgi:hypothetical protein
MSTYAIGKGDVSILAGGDRTRALFRPRGAVNLLEIALPEYVYNPVKTGSPIHRGRNLVIEIARIHHGGGV